MHLMNKIRLNAEIYKNEEKKLIILVLIWWERVNVEELHFTTISNTNP